MNNTKNNPDEINLGEVFQILRRYTLSIVIITIIATTLAIVKAYFSTNIYTTSATIEIKSERYGQTDFMSMALGQQSNNVDNEIEIIQSRWIIQQAQEQLNLNTRYFTTKRLKTVELYKNSPFIAKAEYLSERVSGSFHMYMKSNDSFVLSLEPSLKEVVIYKLKSMLMSVPKEDEPLYYSQVHKFGENISTPWFNVYIEKVFQPENEEYSFYVLADEDVTDIIAFDLSVNTVSEMGTILSVSFQDNIPTRAREIVNAISQAYLQSDLDMKSQSAKKTLNFLDTQLEAINKTLQSSAASLEKYKATNIVIDVSSKAQITAQKLADLEAQKYEIDIQLDVLHNTYEYIKVNDDLSGIDLGDSMKGGSAINALIQQMQEAKTMRNALLVDYTEIHPDVIKINGKLKSLKNTLITSIKNTLSSLQEKKTTLTRFIKENSASLESLPQQERELAQINRSFLVNEKIYSYLLMKRAETAIVESSTVSETRIIDKAITPYLPIKPKRMLMVIVGFILGMIIGIALAFLRNRLNNTIQNIEDIENHSDISLYGAVPNKDSKNGKQPFLEAMRVIRTNLEFLPDNDKKCKLVTITSSIPTEGKTTIATELAKIISSSQKRVLLVDLDMRRARVHERVDIDNTVGMSTLLSGNNVISEVIQKSDEDNLNIITAGPTPPNPSELLMSSNLKTILEQLEEHYDYIILDTPPIGLVTDAMMLMKMSDINLFVFRAKFSKRDFIKNINRFVNDHKLKNSGIILNGLELNKKFGYGYGYGYGYGQAHDYYKETEASS